jgi:hypothetical protein
VAAVQPHGLKMRARITQPALLMFVHCISASAAHACNKCEPACLCCQMLMCRSAGCLPITSRAQQGTLSNTANLAGQHPPSTGAVAVWMILGRTCRHSPATQTPGTLPWEQRAPSGAACSPAHRPEDVMHAPAPHTLASCVQFACTAARKHF